MILKIARIIILFAKNNRLNFSFLRLLMPETRVYKFNTCNWEINAIHCRYRRNSCNEGIFYLVEKQERFYGKLSVSNILTTRIIKLIGVPNGKVKNNPEKY